MVRHSGGIATTACRLITGLATARLKIEHSRGVRMAAGKVERGGRGLAGGSGRRRSFDSAKISLVPRSRVVRVADFGRAAALRRYSAPGVSLRFARERGPAGGQRGTPQGQAHAAVRPPRARS